MRPLIVCVLGTALLLGGCASGGTDPVVVTVTEVETVTPNVGTQADRAFRDHAPLPESGLIAILREEGFGEEEARQAVAELNVDWVEQAGETIRQDGGDLSLSRVEMEYWLQRGGYTEAESQQAVARAAVDWRDNARRAALETREHEGLTHEAIRERLLQRGFTPEETEGAMSHL